jgi:hypothetical protein
MMTRSSIAGFSAWPSRCSHRPNATRYQPSPPRYRRFCLYSHPRLGTLTSRQFLDCCLVQQCLNMDFDPLHTPWIPHRVLLPTALLKWVV